MSGHKARKELVLQHLRITGTPKLPPLVQPGNGVQCDASRPWMTISSLPTSCACGWAGWPFPFKSGLRPSVYRWHVFPEQPWTGTLLSNTESLNSGLGVSSGDTGAGDPLLPFCSLGQEPLTTPEGLFAWQITLLPWRLSLRVHMPPCTPGGEPQSRPRYEEDCGPAWWACDPPHREDQQEIWIIRRSGLSAPLTPFTGTEVWWWQGRGRRGEKSNLSKWTISDFQKGQSRSITHIRKWK